jgi:hypothetical protein
MTMNPFRDTSLRQALGAVMLLALATATPGAGAAAPAHQYPPLRDYLMARDAEIALARSAAPDAVSAHATIKVLTNSGFQVAVAGDNGFVCMVMRGWSAPTFTPAPFRDFVYDAALRAPICFDPVASRTVLPLQELRSALGMQGNDPDAITRGVVDAYATGKLPKMDQVAFAYMWSAHQNLGPGIGAFHPHVMVYAPYYDNAMLGGNAFGGSAPFVSDDAGTPFAVVVIPVHGVAAVETQAAMEHKP